MGTNAVVGHNHVVATHEKIVKFETNGHRRISVGRKTKTAQR